MSQFNCFCGRTCRTFRRNFPACSLCLAFALGRRLFWGGSVASSSTWKRPFVFLNRPSPPSTEGADVLGVSLVCGGERLWTQGQEDKVHLEVRLFYSRLKYEKYAPFIPSGKHQLQIRAGISLCAEVCSSPSSCRAINKNALANYPPVITIDVALITNTNKALKTLFNSNSFSIKAPVIYFKAFVKEIIMKCDSMRI